MTHALGESEMDSILITIKNMLGIPTSYTDFDSQLIVYINSVLAILRQIGVGNSIFTIEGTDEKWSDLFSTEDDLDVEEVKTYVYMKVKLLFDPPTSGIVMDALKQSISEFEWRLNLEADDHMEDA